MIVRTSVRSFGNPPSAFLERAILDSTWQHAAVFYGSSEPELELRSRRGSFCVRRTFGRSDRDRDIARSRAHAFIMEEGAKRALVPSIDCDAGIPPRTSERASIICVREEGNTSVACERLLICYCLFALIFLELSYTKIHVRICHVMS